VARNARDRQIERKLESNPALLTEDERQIVREMLRDYQNWRGFIRTIKWLLHITAVIAAGVAGYLYLLGLGGPKQ
jgi:hypothetical protein